MSNGGMIDTMQVEIDYLRAELARERTWRRREVKRALHAIGTLRWYADEDNYYDPPGAPGHVDERDGELIRDYGERARDTLKIVDAI